MQKAQFTNNPMDSLAMAKSVFIKQTIEWAEMITGYETPNRYQVYYKNHGEEFYTMLFSCKEMSGYCWRNCCSGDARPLRMHIKHATSSHVEVDFQTNLFAVVDKPYKCSCFCLDRPEVVGHFGSEEGPIFGKITQPYTCCDPVFHVKNASGEIIYSITTDCCSCGFCCRGGCGVFEPVTFYIFNGPDGRSDQFNSSVGRIVKHAMGIQSLMSDADNFEVFFPPDATSEYKLLLISSALMIDYSFFEENPNQR